MGSQSAFYPTLDTDRTSGCIRDIAHAYTTEGGLAIAGLEPAAAEALLALPERREEIDRRIEEKFSCIEADFFAPDEKRRRFARYGEAMAALHSGLEKIIAACKKGETIAIKALRQTNNSAKQEKALAALDEINGFITGSEVKEIAGFLFPPEALAEIGASPGEDISPGGASFSLYLKSLINFYRSLAEAAELGV
jgi:hypothetical protein